MAVAHDAASESHSDTTGSVSQASFSWTHTPSGTPRGVLVFTMSDAPAPTATGVTYGGVALTAVTGGEAVDTAGEDGSCKAWFLGSSVPTSAQTVQVTRTNNTVRMWAVCITVTAADDTSVNGTPVLIQEDSTLGEQSVDSGATTTLRYAGIYSGRNVALTTGTNSTALHDFTTGTGTIRMAAVRETTAGSGSRSVGWAATSEDDAAAVHLAIQEGAGGGGGGPNLVRSFAVIVG